MGLLYNVDLLRGIANGKRRTIGNIALRNATRIVNIVTQGNVVKVRIIVEQWLQKFIQIVHHMKFVSQVAANVSKNNIISNLSILVFISGFVLIVR